MAVARVMPDTMTGMSAETHDDSENTPAAPASTLSGAATTPTADGAAGTAAPSDDPAAPVVPAPAHDGPGATPEQSAPAAPENDAAQAPEPEQGNGPASGPAATDDEGTAADEPETEPAAAAPSTPEGAANGIGAGEPTVATGGGDAGRGESTHSGPAADAGGPEPAADADHDAGQDGDVPSPWYRNRTIIAQIITAVVLFSLAIASPFIWNAAKNAYAERNKPVKASSVVTAAHTWDAAKLDKGKVQGLDVNETQYFAHYSNKDYDCFTFVGKGKDPSHTVKITGVFGDSKTRDLITAQYANLDYELKIGRVAVEFCPLLSSDEFSVLATEALAEVDYNNEANTWTMLKVLALTDTTNLNDSDKRIAAITDAVSTIKGADDKVQISDYSLRNGSFVQWAKTMSDQNTVEAIPALYVDGEVQNDSHAFNIYNGDTMFQYLEKLD